MDDLGNRHVPETGLDQAECRTASAILARVGDKWTMPVVAELGGGPRRFNDIRRSLAAISQRMLTLTLRGLERDGLVSRTVSPTTPPRVDYALTPLGLSLLRPIEAVAMWVRMHRHEIDQAQAGYDARHLPGA